MSFLKAEWRKLAIANYVVDKSILMDYLPPGTVLDPWNGIHYLSLVGFMFKNTKVLGLKIPFHVNFEEVNLRFYVRRKSGNDWKRGVVFIKEIVPKHAITFVANKLYKEHYETRAMKHAWLNTETGRTISYEWAIDSKWQKFTVKSEQREQKIEEGSETEFITEHYWGYTKIDEKRTTEYEVTHPKWMHYPVTGYDIDVDFELSYGATFGFLNAKKPTSVMLAEGSLITVEGKRKIKIE